MIVLKIAGQKKRTSVLFVKKSKPKRQARPYRPATPSSIMTPQPAGSQFSASLTGLGLRMSKTRKKTKPASSSYQQSWAQGKKTIHCPKSSSRTTLPGSFCPSSFSAWLAQKLPPTKMAAKMISLSGRESGRKQKGAMSVATSEPIVPGALGESPTGPSVAQNVKAREKKRFFVILILVGMVCGGPTRG